MTEKNTPKEAYSPREDLAGRGFWTMRKKVALVIIIALIGSLFLLQYILYSSRLRMITAWTEKLGDDPEAIKMVLQYLVPGDQGLSSTLMTLFEIIISVWVGLNIYNFLGKDELARLEDKEIALSKALDEQTGRLGKAVEEATQNSYDLTLSTLLNFTSLNSAHYATGMYLHNHFNSWQRNQNGMRINTTIMNAIAAIESLFLSASEANRSKRIKERITTAKTGFGACETLEGYLKSFPVESEEKIFLEGYLHLRRGDFLFYKGYRQKEGHDDLCFAIAEFSDTIHLWFPQIEQKDARLSVKEAELYCIAYLYNIIGECYNVQRQEPMFDKKDGNSDSAKSDSAKHLLMAAEENFEKSVKYVKEASEKYSKTFPSYFSTYYRNFGTAKEADKDEKCIEYYEKALKLNSSDWYSHQTIASYYLKRITDELPKTDKVANDNITTIKEKVLSHVSLLILQSPDADVGYHLACWAYTLMAASYKQLHNEEEYKVCHALAGYFLLLSKDFPPARKEIYDKNAERYKKLQLCRPEEGDMGSGR